MTASELHANLSHFSGGDDCILYRVASNLPPVVLKGTRYGDLKLTFSSGVAYLCEHGKARWLLDAIASHMPTVAKKPDYQPFHIWVLRKVGEGAELLCVLDTDASSMKKPLLKQDIDTTDFPFDGDDDFKLYAGATTVEIDGDPANVMNVYLPSEY